MKGMESISMLDAAKEKEKERIGQEQTREAFSPFPHPSVLHRLTT